MSGNPILTARERLREIQAARLARWADLYAALGRAEQAHATGDMAETRWWLHEAEDAEMELLGECNETVRAAERLGLVVEVTNEHH